MRKRKIVFFNTKIFKEAAFKKKVYLLEKEKIIFLQHKFKEAEFKKKIFTSLRKRKIIFFDAKSSYKDAPA